MAQPGEPIRVLVVDDEADISQQALSFLLLYFRSDELWMRQSHFAFAISRAVKRQMFERANRESGKTG